MKGMRRRAAAAKSLQSCPTLCNPIDSSPSGSPVPGILQARTLDWVAIYFSNTWKWKVKVKTLSCIPLLATPWTAAYQAPPSMGLLRVKHNWATSLSLFTVMHWRRKWQPAPVFLPGESQGQGSLVDCRLRGHTELDMTKVTWRQQQCWCRCSQAYSST